MKKDDDSREIKRLTGSSMHNSQWEALEKFGIRELFGGATILATDPDAVRAFLNKLAIRSGAKCERCRSAGSLRIFIQKPRDKFQPWDYPLADLKVVCPKCHRELNGVR